MFNNIRDFKYKRSPEEALGFFLAYAFLFIVFQLIIGALMVNSGSLGKRPEDIASGLRAIYALIGMGYCGGLCFLMLRQKRIRKWPAWVLIVLSVVGGFANGVISLGAVIGLGVVAYVTTRPSWWPYGPPARKRRPPPPVVEESPAPPPEADTIEAVVEEVLPPAPPEPEKPRKLGPRRERYRPDIIDLDAIEPDHSKKPHKPYSK